MILPEAGPVLLFLPSRIEALAKKERWVASEDRLEALKASICGPLAMNSSILEQGILSPEQGICRSGTGNFRTRTGNGFSRYPTA
jgi:hypothetical protein